jgi:predicted AAA+ superfamily ATPase
MLSVKGYSLNIIHRFLKDVIQSKLGSGQAIILLGARQKGKTTLLHQVFDNIPGVMWLNGDEPDFLALFEHASSARFRSVFANDIYLVLDEAQRIPDIGLKLKLITDQVREIQVIATGSSSFDLANRVNEPLTGGK